MGQISATVDLKEGQDAAAVATNYVTDISSDGIFVHTVDNKTTSAGSGVHIGASAIRIIKAGVEYIKAWVSGSNSYVRIGAETISSAAQGNVLIDSDSVDIRKGTTVLSTFTATGASIGKNSETASIDFCDDLFNITTARRQDSSIGEVLDVQLSTNDASAAPSQGTTLQATKQVNNSSARAYCENSVSIPSDEALITSSQSSGIRIDRNGQKSAAYLYNYAYVISGGGKYSVSRLTASTQDGQSASKTAQIELRASSDGVIRFFADELSINGNTLADYIVEQGTSGYWYYEKYSSGTLKGWYNRTSTVTLSTSSGNGWYRNTSAYTISIPDALECTTLRYVDVKAVNDLANMLVSIDNSSTGFSQLAYYVSHLGSLSSYSTTIMAEIVGTWS